MPPAIEPIELHDLDTTTDPFSASPKLPPGAQLTWYTGADKRLHVVSSDVPAGGDLAAARSELLAWLGKVSVPTGEHFVLRTHVTPSGGTGLTSLLMSDALLVPHGSFVGGTVVDPGEGATGGPRVSLRVAPEADPALRDATKARIGHTIVILVDGEVLATPIVRSAFGGPTILLEPPELPRPEAMAWCNHLVGELSRK